jgi:anionic glutamate receptor
MEKKTLRERTALINSWLFLKYFLFIQKPLVPASTEVIFMEDGRDRKQQRNDGMPTETFCRTWIGTYTLRSKRIDVISRIFFPLVFAVFNMAYWSTYLNQDDDTI